MANPNKELPMINHQDWKLAASGSGVIVFQEVDNHLRVLLSMRAKKVGAGLGITGGGFVECGDIDALQIDTIVQTADEAYREAKEENRGFEKVIDIDSFIERAQPVSLIHARVGDLNRVHVVTMYALRVTDSEWKRIAALKPNKDKERVGPLLEYSVRWNGKIDRREPERFVTIEGVGRNVVQRADFWHKHEIHTIACIAWHAQNGRLFQ